MERYSLSLNLCLSQSIVIQLMHAPVCFGAYQPNTLRMYQISCFYSLVDDSKSYRTKLNKNKHRYLAVFFENIDICEPYHHLYKEKGLQTLLYS